MLPISGLGYRPGMRVLVAVGERQWDARGRTVYNQISLSRFCLNRYHQDNWQQDSAYPLEFILAHSLADIRPGLPGTLQSILE